MIETKITTKELADMLGVDIKTIQRAVISLGMNVERKGKSHTMTFNETQATAIKIELQNHSKVAQNGFTTLTISNDLEMFILQKQLDAYKNRRIAELTEQNERLKIENEQQKPKVEYFDTLINRGNSTNIRNTAKELKIPERQFIKMLQLDGFLYRDKHNQLCPYSEYLQKGYFEVKEWQQGEKTGTQTLITVEGKQFFISKYKQAQSA
ncbi:phage antirepressor KilAC domain-containing protein [Treponema putidum]|uniref:phage antirepressor KilAC domain-containing protein n=1 Tax=Treponema putidum TaxID=221027 RepID=UPI003D909963